MDWKRRAVLASTASVALSGCFQYSGKRPRTSGERSSNGPHTSSSTPDPDEPLYSGETIPRNAPPEAVPPIGKNFDVSNAAEPVLRGKDVTDYGDVDYVADPFLFVEEGNWHMFFEIVNENRKPDAPIGHATSQDGLDWTYNQVVLKKKHHTSFPLTWKYEGEYYMCPPTGKKVELYKAKKFPTDWELVGNAVDVDYYAHDATFIYYKDRWWLFTSKRSGDRTDTVMVYHSDDLDAQSWTPHQGNPVVTDRPKAAQPGGRPIVHDGTLYFYFQDGVANYGDKIRCYEITELTPSTYTDREVDQSPILHEFGKKTDWAGDGMHTFDAWWLGPGKGWRCAVDGKRYQESIEDQYSIGIADLPPAE